MSRSRSKSRSRVLTYLIELDEHDIHFLEAVIEGYDGIATLLRDYKLIRGKTYFKLLVPEGFREEVLRILKELREYAAIGEICEDSDVPG